MQNTPHARRLIGQALHAVRVTREYMPGLPKESHDRVEAQLEVLEDDLIAMQEAKNGSRVGQVTGLEITFQAQEARESIGTSQNGAAIIKLHRQ